VVIFNMTPEQCLKTLERGHFGRLACVRKNEPYIVPIDFAYQDGYLYGFATVGQKIEWMRANPCVCVQIDAVTDRDQWLSVIVTGSYEELPDTPQLEQKALTAYEIIRKRALWWQPGYVSGLYRDPARPPAPVFYRIRIDKITGRRAFPDPTEAAAAGYADSA
jgi:uncharacterized protein